MLVQGGGVRREAAGNVTREAWRSVAPPMQAREQPCFGSGSWKTAGLKDSLAQRGAGKVDLAPFRRLVKVTTDARRGETILSTMHSDRHFAMLLGGLACMATRHEDGTRQIYAFHHPGDFLALHGVLYPESTELIEVEALSNCSVGTIDRSILEQEMQDHPELGQALWRAAMMEAGIFRQRLLMARWPAQQRVAHLLCEQLSRIGPKTSIIPLSQIDVADTVGLSVVHTSRVFKDLRRLGVLSNKRCIEVVHQQRLRELATFNGGYRSPTDTLTRWDVRIEG